MRETWNEYPSPEETAGDTAAPWHLRLYIAGGSSGSLQAVNLMQRLCAERPHTRLEIVDIYAEDFTSGGLPPAGVITAPSMVRLAPLPVALYVGDFSDEQSVASIFHVADRE